MRPCRFGTVPHLALLVIAMSGFDVCRGQPAPATRPDTQPSRQPPVMIETEAISLGDLVSEADRIFVGRVESVSEEEQSVSSKVKLQVQVVVFKVERVLKDETKGLQVGHTYTVRQAKHLSRSVHPGEELLWYLAPNGELGLTQPVGVASGDFRILRGEGGRRVAINMKNNESLFDKDSLSSLAAKVNAAAAIIPDPDERNRVANVMSAQLEKVGPATAGKPVDLDLIVAGTRLLDVGAKK